MKKECDICGPQEVEKFNKNKDRKDGLHTRCRECMKKYLKEHYQKGRDYYLEKTRKRNRETRMLLRTMKEGKPCVDCGNEFHYAAMQFDHLPGRIKVICPSRIRGWSDDKILEELAKCEVVCANCHAIRTFKREINSNGESSNR